MKQGIAHRPNGETNFHGHIKNNGGSWFAVAHNTTSGHSRNPVHELSGQKGIPHRKAASAAIAKIPFPLASYIARVFRPEQVAA